LRKDEVLVRANINMTRFVAGIWDTLVGLLKHTVQRKRAERPIQTNPIADRTFTGRLTLLSKVTTDLSKAADLDTLCRRATELAIAHLGVDRFSIWFVSKDRTHVQGTYGVDENGEITDERNVLLPIILTERITPVIQGEIPFMRTEDTELFTKGIVVGRGHLVSAGLWDGEKVIGFISADNLLRHQPIDDHDCEILRLYASAVGHLCSLKRVEEELQAAHIAEREFSNRLTELSEATTELSHTPDLDALCRRATELAITRLNIDRFAIWFLSEDGIHMRGSFGVDADGKITDERSVELPIDPVMCTMHVVRGEIPFLRVLDMPLYTQGMLVGRGTRVSAGLWDGEKVIGFIGVDNLLRHQPIDDHDCEILRLYASAVGHLCSLKRAEEANVRLAKELEQRVVDRTAQLETANEELNAFNYSISHDLRAPLRSLTGFSQILEREYADKLGAQGIDFLQRIRAASERMNELINDLLHLSRITRSGMQLVSVDISAMAASIIQELQSADPDRTVEVVITPGLTARADSHLLRIALENLLNNAWKFTSKAAAARIEFTADPDSHPILFRVRDNGAGFDMRYADRLFGVFQRMHGSEEFEGTGIGLSIVQRVIHRHNGRVWAESAVDQGSTFYFTLESLPMS
jgi:signal transduction histidine kinase/GAF domain-containing protein